MIGTLARKRMHMRVSHLAAVATLVALLGAMFVSVGSVSAATGDVSAISGFCVEGPGPDGTFASDGQADNGDESADNTRIVRATSAANGTPITIEVPDDGGTADEGTLVPGSGRDLDSEPDHVTIECNAALAGLPVSVTPDVSGTAIVTAKSAALSVSVNDSDNVVAAGGPDLTVTIRFSNIVQFTHDSALNADADATNNVAVASTPIAPTAANNSTEGENGLQLLWIRVSGELDNPMAQGATWANSMRTASLAVPAGTAAGEYTISAAVRYDPNTAVADDDGDGDADDKDGTVLTGSVTITVGDTGMNAASADLSLGTATYDTATTVKDETIPEDGTEAASGGDVWLKLVTSNSLDKLSNSGGLTGLTVIAPGGKLSIHAPNPATGRPNRMAVPEGTGDNSAQITTSVGNTMFILVSKADRKPGMVDVYAQVVGTDGAPRSNTLPLAFTGASSSLTLGEPKSVVPGGMTEFTVDASDSAGNAGSVGQLSFKVTDAAGKGVSTGKVKITKDTAGSSTPDKETDDNGLQTVGLVETANTTAPGVYTIEASIPGVAGSAATTELIVAGPVAEIVLSLDELAPTMIGQRVSFTVEATDKNGAPVADKTRIFITASDVEGDGDSVLVLALQGADNNSGYVETEDGIAEGWLVAVGSGSAVVTASNGAGFDVKVVESTAGAEEPEAMPEEEASVSCLSELSGFATWSCGVEADASAIFDMVTGRGVSAIHLWNGSTWVRYSVVDDAMVPGSSDFMVTENDILYISN